MVLIDAVARLVPGVVGDPESLAQDTFSSEPSGWPQFTRPAEIEAWACPMCSYPATTRASASGAASRQQPDMVHKSRS